MKVVTKHVHFRRMIGGNASIQRFVSVVGVIMALTVGSNAAKAKNVDKPNGTPIVSGTLDETRRSVKWYGAVGDGTVDDSKAVSDAIAAAVESKSYVVFPEGTYLIDKSITLDVPADLKPFAVLKPAGGATISTSGQVLIKADDRSTHFDCSLGGKIINLNKARPEWFGGKPNGSDTRKAFEDAEASLIMNGELRLDKGDYVFNGTTGPIITKKALKIKGSGPNSSMVTITGPKSNFFQFFFTEPKHESAPGFEVRDLSFKCAHLTASGYVIDVENVSGVHQGTDSFIDNVHFGRFGRRVFGGIRIGPGVQLVTIQNILGANMENYMLFHNAFNCTVSNFKGGGGDRKSSVGIRIIAQAGGSGGGINENTHAAEAVHHAYSGSEAIDFHEGMLVNFGRCLSIEGEAPERYKCLSSAKFQRIYFDDGKLDECVHISNATHLWFSECYIVSAERYGAFLDNCHQIHFQNCQFDVSAFGGLHVEGNCTGIFLTGGSAADNGWAAKDETEGFGVRIASGATEVKIMGMDCRGSRPEKTGGFDRPQGTGIYIGGECDNFVVMGNIVTGNRYNNIANDAGTSPTKILCSNVAP